MPVIILIVVLAVAAVCAAAFFAVRAYKHRKLAEQLDKRDDDQVHYAFVINPSKPQAEQRKQHIQEFCEAKHLTQVEYIGTQLDKDGRACALEALEHGADVVVTARCARWRAHFREPATRWASSLLAPAICLPAIWAFLWMISMRH